jgi:hypothetical protein
MPSAREVSSIAFAKGDGALLAFVRTSNPSRVEVTMKYDQMMIRRTAVFGALVPLLLACGSDGPEGVAVSLQEIANGTAMSDAQVATYGLVALYHPGPNTSTIFKRPCSASIVRSTFSVSWVLTARHCVTVPNTIMGAAVSAQSLFLAPYSNPGPSSFGLVPGGSFRAVEVRVPEAPAEDSSYDFALVRVNQDWSSRQNYRFAFWVGNPQALVGLPFTAFGYGVDTADSSCASAAAGYPSPGAGFARSGGEFTVGGISGGAYWFNNLSTGGQAVYCGDSGGPDFANIGPEDFVWTHQIGVHSRGAGPTGISTLMSSWIQDQLGGYYLSTDWMRDQDVGINANNQAWRFAKTDARVRLFKYNTSTQRISFMQNGSTRCLGLGANSSVMSQTCSSSNAQKWTISNHRTIQNVQSSQCLMATDGSDIRMQPCSFATIEIGERQHWAFHPQP